MGITEILTFNYRNIKAGGSRAIQAVPYKIGNASITPIAISVKLNRTKISALKTIKNDKLSYIQRRISQI